MHRSVSSEDVMEYSTGARKKDMQLEREEDIEYQSGHLLHSSGVMSVKMARSPQKMRRRRETPAEGPLSDQVSSNASYTLDLVRCSRVASAKRNRSSEKTSMMKDTLKSTINIGNMMHIYLCIITLLVERNMDYVQ